MSRLVVIVLLVLGTATAAQAQNDSLFQLYGRIVDGSTQTPVTEAHVINTKRSTGTITTDEGYFNMPFQYGDTLEITAIGYLTKYLHGMDHNPNDTVFFLARDTLNLRTFSVLGKSRYEQFKEDFENMPMQSGRYDPILPTISAVPTGPSSGGAGVAVSGGVTAIYNYFSQQGTKKRKMNRARKIIAREAMEVVEEEEE